MIIDRDSEVPVYVQIANQIRDQILSGKLPAGRRIPTKRYFRENHGVSGVTFDKATAILKAEGLIRPSKGLGLFVIPENERAKPKRDH
jgi:DNA-binding transcriptional regulator YhcF (GntR family)